MIALSSLMEKWDSLAYLSYNALARMGYWAKYPILKKYIARNKVLKNRHAGERCFILLNGPSLDRYDLAKLEKEKIICTNYFYETSLGNVVKPDYYCIADSEYFTNPDSESQIDSLLRVCSYSTFLFNIKYLATKRFNENSNIHVVYSKHMPSMINVRDNLDGFSSGYASVSLFAISAAIFMGFKRIYLLGYDFEPGFFSHFYEESGLEKVDYDKQRAENGKDKVCGRYWHYSQAHYQNYYIFDHGIRKRSHIFNCNAESCVRAFPFTSYESLF
jgi:hypothetical protein